MLNHGKAQFRQMFDLNLIKRRVRSFRDLGFTPRCGITGRRLAVFGAERSRKRRLAGIAGPPRGAFNA